jgi:hypothetical protein
VVAWFQRSAGWVQQHPVREDRYLRLPDTRALGIKLREGRIEVKQRVRNHGLVRFHERAAGIVEHWRKWSFQLAPGYGALPGMALPAASWVPVRKERLLTTYRLTADQTVVPVSSPQPLRRGCEMELTAVHAAGQDWWTLAFEAFGEESLLREQLVRVARHVLAAGEPPRLDAPDSQGYADWLVRITQQETPV